MKDNVLFGYAYGLFLKILSTLSKILFLIFIVPALPDGIYAGYLYGISVTIIPAMLLSIGVSEHLPILIKGDLDKMDLYSPFYTIAMFSCFVSIVLYVITGNHSFLLLSIMFVHIIYYVVAGLLRSIEPHYYEWLINFPTILLLVICFIIPIQSVDQLLIVFFVTNIIIYVVTAFIGKVKISAQPSKIRQAFGGISDTAWSGLSKAISNMFLIVNFRSLIIFPKLFFSHTPNDILAIAISAGEAIFQLAMVIVNRNYIHYCNKKGEVSYLLTNSFLLFLAIVVIGSIFILFNIPIVIMKFDWPLVGWVILFFSGVIVFMELRNYLWAHNVGSQYIFMTQVLLACTQIVIINTFNEALWVPISALVCMGSAILFLGFSFLWKK